MGAKLCRIVALQKQNLKYLQVELADYLDGTGNPIYPFSKPLVLHRVIGILDPIPATWGKGREPLWKYINKIKTH